MTYDHANGFSRAQRAYDNAMPDESFQCSLCGEVLRDDSFIDEECKTHDNSRDNHCIDCRDACAERDANARIE